MNGCKQITGRMYVLRASPDYPGGWPVLTINAEVVEAVKAGQLDSGGMVKQIRQAYKEMMKDDEMEDDDIDRQLSSFGEDPYIVLVSGHLPEELLPALQQRYPAITFFLLEKDDDLDLKRLQTNGIEFLFPNWRGSGTECLRSLYQSIEHCESEQVGIVKECAMPYSYTKILTLLL